MSFNEFYDFIQEAYHIENKVTVETVDFKNIIEVTTKELIYKNSDGAVKKIALSECVKNFEAINGEARNHLGEKLNCVGGRFFSETYHSAFYEFFAQNHIRFSLELKQSKFRSFLLKIGLSAYRNEFSLFYSLQKRLNAVGYTAMDLT